MQEDSGLQADKTRGFKAGRDNRNDGQKDLRLIEPIVSESELHGCNPGGADRKEGDRNAQEVLCVGTRIIFDNCVQEDRSTGCE